VSSRVLPFLDEERFVIAGIRARLNPAYGIRTDLPNPIEPALPLVQVIRVGGSLNTETTVFGRVDLYCMAATRAAMWTLTADVQAAMGSLTEADVNGQTMDVVRTIMGPSFLAWSATVPRSVTTYELQYRPRPA
jgi:hypothetical protein